MNVVEIHTTFAVQLAGALGTFPSQLQPQSSSCDYSQSIRLVCIPVHQFQELASAR